MLVKVVGQSYFSAVEGWKWNSSEENLSKALTQLVTFGQIEVLSQIDRYLVTFGQIEVLSITPSRPSPPWAGGCRPAWTWPPRTSTVMTGITSDDSDDSNGKYSLQ